MQGNLLTVEEFCARAGIGKSTFRKYRHKNPDMFPPAIKKGTQPFFTEEQVEQFKACAVSKRNNPVSNVVPLPDAPALVSTKGDTLSEETAEEVTISQGSEEDADEETFKAVIPTDDDDPDDELIDPPEGTAAEIKCGELLNLMPKATTNHKNQGLEIRPASKFLNDDSELETPKPKLEVAKEMGFNKNQVSQFQTLADNPDVDKVQSVVDVPAPMDAPEIAPAVMTLDQRANRIRQLFTDVARGIIEIGFELIEAKKQVGHGGWSEWLQKEFGATYGLDERTARNYMSVAHRFGNRKTFSDLGKSKLIKLLALPEGTEEEFIESQSKAGRPVESQSARQVEKSVKEFKQTQITGGSYFNMTDSPELDSVVDKLNHVSQSPSEPLQCISESESRVSIPPAQIAPETPTTTTETFSPLRDFALTVEEPQGDAKKLPPIARNRNGSVEWHTPQTIIAAVHETLGHIDLDPASCAIANETVRADKFFSAQDNGLDKDWHGNIFMNPPFTQGVIEQFVTKFLSQLDLGNVKAAIVLTDAATDTSWFRSLASRASAFVLTRRINFLKGGTFEAGSPTRGQAVFYFGNDSDKFYHAFAQFGLCCKAVMPLEGKKSLFDFEEDAQ